MYVCEPRSPAPLTFALTHFPTHPRLVLLLHSHPPRILTLAPTLIFTLLCSCSPTHIFALNTHSLTHLHSHSSTYTLTLTLLQREYILTLTSPHSLSTLLALPYSLIFPLPTHHIPPLILWRSHPNLCCPFAPLHPHSVCSIHTSPL